MVDRVPRGRALGAAFEHRIKKILGGRIYPGLAADVEARGFRIECKHRTGMKLGSTTEFRDFLDQIKRYEDAEPEERFIGAITGGRSYQNGRAWVFMPIETFAELTEPTAHVQVASEVARLRKLLEEYYEREEPQTT
jgi:hypothetical protein